MRRLSRRAQGGVAINQIHQFSRVFLAFLILAFCFCSCAWAAKEPPLPPRYAHWLHEEVNYLITDDERKLFLKLPTDDARDKFIDTFWNARNPDPNAPTNAFKETHYERLAYANAHFGYGNVQDGWRSDRGMVYITLGAPQQIEKYPENNEVRPIQIWFYENLSGALPIHFYVLFYKQSAAEDYELYSPYGDRPQKLISSTNAINDDKTAIKLIQKNLGDEAAHVSLSLIPGEPVDLQQPAPSLQSDVLLNNIRNYRNLPQVRDMLAAHASAEGVSHRLLLGGQFSDLAAIATRDPEKQTSIHYLLRLLNPADFYLAQEADGRYYYSVQLETQLIGADGKTLLDRTQRLTDYVANKTLPQIKGKCFGIEGRIPVDPGKYQLSLTLTNLATKQAYRQTRSVLVPDFGDKFGVSQLFFADSRPPLRSLSVQAPFSFQGVRLRPIGSDNASITQGEPLRMIFQVWAPAGSPAQLQGKKLDIHYLIGKLNSQTRVEENQEVDRGSFTPEGSLLIGKDLRTDTLAPGVYRLVVRVTEPESSATASESLNFEVRDPSNPVAALWTVDVPDAKNN